MLPVYRWATLIEKGLQKEQSMAAEIRRLRFEFEQAFERAQAAEIRAELAEEREKVAAMRTAEAEKKRLELEQKTEQAITAARLRNTRERSLERQRSADAAAEEALAKAKLADQLARESIQAPLRLKEKNARTEAQMIEQKQLAEKRKGS